MPSSENTPNLLDLPPHILIKILTHLRNDIEPEPFRKPHPPNFPPVQHSLNMHNCLTIPLPSVLLPIATVSPLFARAAASVTGAQYTYLTPQTTGYQLHKWVRALAPFVKAVAADENLFETLADLTSPVRNSLYNNLLSDSLKLFDSLSTNLVKLEVLDIVHLPFHVLRMHDALLTALYTALESNSATLGELALPAYAKSDLCASALELATLRRLQVFTVELQDKPTIRSSAYVTCEPIFRMLQALDGHADRALGITKVQDLRIINDSGTFRIGARSGLRKSFFESVRILRLKTVPQLYPGFYIPRFDMFSQLESLYWNEIPRFSHDFLIETCSVQEIHSCNVRWFTQPQLGNEEVDGLEAEWRLRNTVAYLTMHTYCLRTFAMRGTPNPSNIAVISKVCTNLENVSFVVSSQNVKELQRMLRRCRRMHVLELVLDEDVSGQLEDDAWYTIAKAVKASKSLSQFAILVRDDSARMVTFVSAVVNCCVSVVESVSSRARRLAFRIPLTPRKLVAIYQGVTKILNACKNHTPALEFLKVDLFAPRFRQQDPDMAEIKRAKREVIFAKEELLETIECLRGLEFGFLNKIFDYQKEVARKSELLKFGLK